ncbi:response regulator [Deinococcus arenae]|uniref:Response regulator n=1 Tax=Deinococcus arenae TaxID=1452751 RepID=A0A8H9GQT4_9DEIO|nr:MULTISPECIES: response regulator [Deinococcus]AWT37216.1 response regulator [Deinococcus actinosclerus]GGM40766.1 response regulator [Deinococcus arenae]
MNTRRILLIDDNPNDVELALTALDESEAEGSAVDVAGSGSEALTLLRRARDEGTLPDLVLLDLNMPHMDGIAVLDAIRAERGLQGLPVVMLTTSGESRDIRESYAHGASAYVVKPMDFKQFREALRTIQAFWTALNRPPRMN